MKKELVICIIIIVLILATNIVTQQYTKKCTTQMNEMLEVLKEKVLAEKENKDIDGAIIMGDINNIENKWNEYQETLAYYIEHDELEKVETQIWSMKGFNEIEKYDEVVPELEKCIFILEHIQDKTKINVKNIF